MSAQIQFGCEVEFFGLLGVLVEGEQTPLGSLSIEVREAQLCGAAAAFRNKERERTGMGVSREMLTAVIEPEDGDGHRVIDGGLGLTLAAADEGDPLLTTTQQAARTDRSEGMFKIGGGGEAFERPTGKELGNGALQRTAISGAHGFQRRGRSPLGLGADLHARGFGLAEAQDREL